MTHLTVIIAGLTRGLDVDHLYEDIFNVDHLHRNLITLNLFPHRLSYRIIEMLETKLKLKLATSLWSPKAVDLSGGQIALYIQALKASCSDPRDFYGLDLIKELRKSIPKSEFEEHLMSLTFCITAPDVEKFEAYMGQERLTSLLNRTEENKGSYSNDSDTMALRSLALSCYSKLTPSNETIRHNLNDRLAEILMLQDPNDGSFGGSLISTSLVLQAFIDSGLNELSFLWNRRAASQFINTHLNQMNSLDAYYVVPAFHETWQNIGCKKNRSLTQEEKDAEEKSLFSSVYKWFDKQKTSNVTISRWVNVEGNGTKVSLSIPQGSTLMKALKDAAKKESTFTYDGDETTDGYYVKDVGYQREDPSTNHYWIVHQQKSEDEPHVTKPIKESKSHKLRKGFMKIFRKIFPKRESNETVTEHQGDETRDDSDVSAESILQTTTESYYTDS